MAIGVPTAVTVATICIPWRDWTAAKTCGWESLELSTSASSLPMYNQ
eukprot:CAMPEP_0198583656 /NCGR_PEP_ID=MMETSP1462-20131121/127024_1 /TAXON_ID=1333877 /ORGANISM="Brandtodinium nutriculum, Strain RCC3387" /LENGTH=46 /DNA_ID= /DNA_START= /DNA_END= /DNA_ORIENTATION=